MEKEEVMKNWNCELLKRITRKAIIQRYERYLKIIKIETLRVAHEGKNNVEIKMELNQKDYDQIQNILKREYGFFEVHYDYNRKLLLISWYI